jgi:hypothetical protein
MSERLSAQSLKNNINDAARQYLWEMVIPNPIGGGDVDALRFRARTTVIPGASHGEIHLDYKSSQGINLPGRVRFPQKLACTFIESEDSAIWNAITEWRKKITDPIEGNCDGDVNIKSDIYLNLITQNDSEWLKLKVIGAYPSEIADATLDNDTDAVITFSVTFTYDAVVKES